MLRENLCDEHPKQFSYIRLFSESNRLHWLKNKWNFNQNILEFSQDFFFFSQLKWKFLTLSEYNNAGIFSPYSSRLDFVCVINIINISFKYQLIQLSLVLNNLKIEVMASQKKTKKNKKPKKTKELIFPEKKTVRKLMKFNCISKVLIRYIVASVVIQIN